MKNFAVIGMGRFGESLAKTLYSEGYEVLAVDLDQERIDTIAPYVTHAVQADGTDEMALKALGLRNFDVIVIAMGDMQSSILSTLLCKEMGVPYVAAKANNAAHAKVLFRMGIDKVVFPERDMGVRVAHSLVTGNILDYIELSPDFGLIETSVPKEWEGKTLQELDVRVRYGINIMAIKNDEGIVISPSSNDKLNAGDVIIIIGDNTALKRIEKM